MKRQYFYIAAAASLCLPLSACGNKTAEVPQVAASSQAFDVAQIDKQATDFVRIGLIFGNFDKNYVDAFTGDPKLREAAKAHQMRLPELFTRAEMLVSALDDISENLPADVDDMTRARLALLRGDAVALHTRMRMAQGENLPFDEETRLLYDAVAPTFTEAQFAAARAKLDAANKLRDKSGEPPTRVIPQDKVRVVMEKAIAECRARTVVHYDLPEGESFDLEFVKDKPWSAYNWYKGNYRSLIEVNQDLPLTIERALDLGCHEGYPGHHVFNVRVEDVRIKQNGWPEAELVALYSPSSPLMEGSANYGLELAFPGLEKKRYDAEVLYPLAGLTPPTNIRAADPELANARMILSNSGVHVAREYLDGRMTREQGVEFYMKYDGRSRKRAEQGLDFIETYRGYIINYTLGQDVVRDWIDMRVEGGQDRWEAFQYLLDTPVTVGQLQDDLKQN